MADDWWGDSGGTMWCRTVIKKGCEKDGKRQRGFRRKWVRQKQMILGGLRLGDSWCLI